MEMVRSLARSQEIAENEKYDENVWGRQKVKNMAGSQKPYKASKIREKAENWWKEQYCRKVQYC